VKVGPISCGASSSHAPISSRSVRRPRTDFDRGLLFEHLEQALHHVANGEAHVRQQRGIVAWLDARGLDASIARDLLATYERVLIMHTADRRKSLADLTVRSLLV
jgi:hypothetical protein